MMELLGLWRAVVVDSTHVGIGLNPTWINAKVDLLETSWEARNALLVSEPRSDEW